ncbi:MAG: rod shape-determining protein RodA [Actinobacteria bacterium]|nr:MAG: rod shape-determining protein RodA [Actinomycetota bacterium]TMK22557.1 MAG: rod shape-determining protein RodA [Actinomycetota bacterium]TMM22202.1 MAG: rod shape-determining protein RodA [Actinomycetota bacterium]
MDMVAGRVWADERRPIRHVDWVLVLLTVVLTVVGLVLLHSISATTPGEAAFWLVRVMKQGATAGFGLLFVALIAAFDYRFFKVYAGFIYVAALAALVLVKIPGIGATDPSGVAQRWFAIAGLQITPSEITKVCAIVMLAAILSEIRAPEPALGDLVRVLAVAAVPLVLVFIQPDIGTSIVLAAIVVGMLIVAGTRLKHLLVLTAVGLVLIGLAFQLGVIQDFQRQRLTAFLDRANVSEDARYNLDQSLIAVGSGGLFGRGYLKGTQTNLDYVPRQHTDFIFTVAGEEFGFVGSMFVLLLYALILWRAIRIATLSKDPFGTLVAAGVASMFAIQMFVNVGMVIGIMPITGIPLPFLSYGGSSILVSFAAIGVLESIHMRRFS